MDSSSGYRRPSLLPLLIAAIAAFSLAGYATVGQGVPAGESSVQQAREAADEVSEEGDQTGKEESLAYRPEREEAKLEREEEELEATSRFEAASQPAAADPGEEGEEEG
jgi:hypothetical protein